MAKKKDIKDSQSEELIQLAVDTSQDGIQMSRSQNASEDDFESPSSLFEMLEDQPVSGYNHEQERLTFTDGGASILEAVKEGSQDALARLQFLRSQTRFTDGQIMLSVGKETWAVVLGRMEKAISFLIEKGDLLSEEDLRGIASWLVIIPSTTASTTSGRKPVKLLGIHTPCPLGYTQAKSYPVEGLRPGMIAILGRAGSGKSEFIVNTLQPQVLIRCGEPQERFDESPSVIKVSSVLEAFSLSCLFGVCGLRVAIDGFRDLYYRLDGAAAEGGLTAAVYNVLTGMNNVYASLGTNVFVAVNPQTTNEDKFNDVVERHYGAIVGVIKIEDSSPTMDAWRTENGRVHDVFSTGQVKTSSLLTYDPKNKGQGVFLDVGFRNGPAVEEPRTPTSVREMSHDLSETLASAAERVDKPRRSSISVDLLSNNSSF